MSNSIRSVIYKKITESFQKSNSLSKNIKASHLTLKYDEADELFSFQFPLRTKAYNVQTEAQCVTNSEIDKFVKNIEHVKTYHSELLSFRLDRNQYVKEMLENNMKGITAPLLDTHINNVVVEFSSPNIAKPFHVGHLRSTIIGNYIANLNRFLRNRVTTINYLGDWGTQFGFVQLGLKLANISESAMKEDPINSLYKAYVYAHNLSKEDSTIEDKAREIFKLLEEGDNESVKEWEVLRCHTVDELRKTYSRTGITFDEYHWESMYNAKKLKILFSELERLDLLTTDEHNRKVICLNDKKSVPLLKSDGSTLYITRDVAAAIDRFNNYKFDVMFYVVDNAQTEHFSRLVNILERMQYPWASRLKHVKFGKIRGMSTRKGTAVFLTDILDETRAVMKEKQIKSPNTKVPLNIDDNSADILGVSAVIVNDLKQKRTHDYDFDWNKALDIRGETGVKLQYTHCRLVSLEENSGMEPATECNPELLREPCVNELLFVLGLFEETIFKSHETLEPCILVNYLFRLSHVINKSLLLLRVKDAPSDVASQRMLVFHVAKNVLAEGMRLLGLTPLSKM